MRRCCICVLFALGLTTGCVDVRNFEGSWSGRIVTEEAVRQGFSVSTQVERLEMSEVSLQTISANLTTDDGRFERTPLQRVIKLANDSLASLTFDGAPLRSYLLFAPLVGELTQSPASIVISLFGDDHLELRIFRGNDLFGVFNLNRPER
jgi:hypothetical protein